MFPDHLPQMSREGLRKRHTGTRQMLAYMYNKRNHLPAFQNAIIPAALTVYFQSTANLTTPSAHQRKTTYTCRGGSRIFFRRGALVSCATSTPINHIVFHFLQNTSCIRKPQVISRGGCAPPAPSP